MDKMNMIIIALKIDVLDMESLMGQKVLGNDILKIFRFF